MFWNLVKKIDQNKISARKAREIYDEIFDDLDEEQQEILENKISELEEEENYWEMSKKITSREFYEDSDIEESIEDQLHEMEDLSLEEEEPEEE